MYGEIHFVGDGTLNVHIRHLREKIENNPKDPQFIKTVWGTGYVLEDNKPMRLKLLMVTILVVFSAGIVSSVIVIKNNPITEVDLIAINDVVKTVEKNWGTN